MFGPGKGIADTRCVLLGLVEAKLPVSGAWRDIRGQCPVFSLFRPGVTLSDSEAGDEDVASLGVQN